MKKTGINDGLQKTLAEAINNLDDAHKRYKSVKKLAYLWQNDFLHELAEAKAQQNNTSKETELKILKSQEKQCNNKMNIPLRCRIHQCRSIPD